MDLGVGPPRINLHYLNACNSVQGLLLKLPRLSLSLGETLTFSLNSTRLIRKPVNADNGHLLLVLSTSSHRPPTSLIRTPHYQLSAVTDLSFLKVKKSFSSVCRCFQRYHAPDRIICRVNFCYQTSYRPRNTDTLCGPFNVRINGNLAFEQAYFSFGEREKNTLDRRLPLIRTLKRLCPY